jgi:hypothetical protein
MSSSGATNSDTFCSLAHFGLFNENPYKTLSSCCAIDTNNSQFANKKNYNLQDDTFEDWYNSEYQRYLRSALDNNIKLPECNTCWHKEETGFTSLRQVANNDITNDIQKNDTWLKLYFSKNNKPMIIHADIKLSNLCNYGCVMCGPHDSSKIYSKWIVDQSSEFVKDKLAIESNYFEKIHNDVIKPDYDFLRKILNFPLKVLSITGGEPLLDNKLIEILSTLDLAKQKKITLVFVTNGSIDLLKTYGRLKNFKSVTFVVSLESTGAIQNYIRKYSKWDYISKNINTALAHGIKIQIHTVIQALSLQNLHELVVWCKEHGIKQEVTTLVDPHYLSINILPQAIINESLAKLHKIGEIDLINYINKSYKDETVLYPKFLRYIKWYENDSDLKLVDILPNLQ